MRLCIKNHEKLSCHARWIIPCVGISLMLLSGCIQAPASQEPLQAEPTFTITQSPTSTIEWFPPTSTPTIAPTSEITPTPEEIQEQGNIIVRDDFSNPEFWILGHTSSGNVTLGLNELTIAISEPGAYDYSVRSEPILDNFFIEITTSPTLCQGEDQYGLLLRMSSPGNFYRYALSCDGRVRLDRIIQGVAYSPQPWIQNNSLPPGAPLPARLGVRLQGKEMDFFVNGQYQFSVSDPTIQSGNIGVFARSMGENAVTVNFSELIVRQVVN
jgi:hypothetical protein